MNTLTIRTQGGRLLGTAVVGSRAVLWRDCTAPVRDLIETSAGDWFQEQLWLIADPSWQPDRPRLARSQREWLDTVVTVRDEGRY